MIPNHQIVNLLSRGALLPAKYVSYGDDSLCRGGLVIGDGSGGIDLQTWRARITDPNTVTLTPLTSGVGQTFNVSGVQAASVAFDRGMLPTIAFVEGGVCSFRWFDTVANQFVTTVLSGVRNIMAVHDDVRDSSSSTSDVIITYQKGQGVYWREQRDRYSVEYTAAASIPGELKAFGMGSQWAVLWRWAPPT